MGLKRLRVVAKGEVQKVGYRDQVQRIARKLGLKGYIKNIKPYDVEIVAEGEEEKLLEFLERTKIRRFPIFVDDLEVVWQKPRQEFEYFEIRREDWREELFERIDLAGKLLYRTVELGEENLEIGKKTLVLAERSVAIGEKMLEKQDETIRVIREESEKTRRELGAKIDRVGEILVEESEKTRGVIREESEKTRKEVVGEVSGVRSGFVGVLGARLGDIESRLSRMEEALRRAGIL